MLALLCMARRECHLVDKFRIGVLSGPHTHGALQHPGAAETGVVRIDGRQRLLVERIRLHHMPDAEARTAGSPVQTFTGMRICCISAFIMFSPLLASGLARQILRHSALST